MSLWIDVRRLRKSRGWLQWEAAEQLGISRAYLSIVETGKRGVSVNMMEAIIHVFGVKYEDFTPLRYKEGVTQTKDRRRNLGAATQTAAE